MTFSFLTCAFKFSSTAAVLADKAVQTNRKPFCHCKLCAPCPSPFQSFTRGENTHHRCSQGSNVSGRNGDCLIVSRRPSIDTLPADAITTHTRLLSRTATGGIHSQQQRKALAQHWQASTITARLNLLKQQSFFFARKRQTASSCRQAGKTGWRRETQHRAGTYTETNKQVWLV